MYIIQVNRWTNVNQPCSQLRNCYKQSCVYNFRSYNSQRHLANTAAPLYPTPCTPACSFHPANLLAVMYTYTWYTTRYNYVYLDHTSTEWAVLCVSVRWWMGQHHAMFTVIKAVTPLPQLYTLFAVGLIFTRKHKCWLVSVASLIPDSLHNLFVWKLLNVMTYLTAFENKGPLLKPTVWI